MPELFLMRHAKAKRARGDMDDRQRPLRKRGRRQAAAMARPLWHWQAFDGEIHVSSARRTVETLETLAAQLPELRLVERAERHATLYACEGRALREWLRMLPAEAQRVLVIGHNPALVELACWLCRDAPDSLPTGGVLHLSLPDDDWSSSSRGCATSFASLLPAEASHALFRRQAPQPPAFEKADMGQCVRRQLCHQYRLIRALEPGVIAGWDPEFLHQYRVNLRRSRAVGEAVRAAVDAPGLKPMLKRLKRRAQATSDLRDLDVFRKSLEECPPPLPAAQQSAFSDWLAAQARERHAELCCQLARPDYAEDMHAWRQRLDAKRFRQALAELTPARVEAVLTKRIAQHDRKLAAISHGAGDDAVHDLRKQVKRIRYLAELDPKRHRELLARLKRHQTLLGDFQDRCARQVWIETFMRDACSAADQRTQCDRWLTELEHEKQALRQRLTDESPPFS